MKGQPISVKGRRDVIQKSHWAPDRMAECRFFVEEAFGFLESCSLDDEKYFAALIRMYGRSLEIVSSLLSPPSAALA